MIFEDVFGNIKMLGFDLEWGYLKSSKMTRILARKWENDSGLNKRSSGDEIIAQFGFKNYNDIR